MADLDKTGGPRGDARREAILEAAWALFLEKGFERTTLSDIIALSKGSRSTLYEAFGDKTGLFESVISLKCREFAERFREVPLAGGDPQESLTEFGLRYAEGVLAPESAKFMRLMIASSEQLPSVIDAFFKDGPQTIRSILSDYLRDATQRGELHVANPDEAATVFLGFLHSDLYLRVLLSPQAPPTVEESRCLVEHTVAIFLNGVR